MTTQIITQSQLDHINQSDEFSDPSTLLKFGFKNFNSNIALASSFGLEDVVLIDIMTKINPKSRVFTLDTGRLNPETYDVMEKIREKYNIKIEIYFPNTNSVEKMVSDNGINLFYESVENRQTCCGIRKIEPLNRALNSLDAWITGIRMDQTSNRKDMKRIEIDTLHNNMIKINPLLDWNLDMVWKYIKDNQIPYNKLHDKGFPSIGCAPCTRPIEIGEDPRAGRWWWEGSSKECGLHENLSSVNFDENSFHNE